MNKAGSGRCEWEKALLASASSTIRYSQRHSRRHRHEKITSALHFQRKSLDDGWRTLEYRACKSIAEAQWQTVVKVPFSLDHESLLVLGVIHPSQQL